METEYLGFLAGVAFLAGAIDSIAGGGGLLTFPALLFTGMSPAQAIGTSKFFSSCGTSMATFNFARKKLIAWRLFRAGVLPTILGALMGSQIILWIDPEWVRILVLIFLPLAASSLFLKQKDHAEEKVKYAERKAIGLGTGLGFYDGFFGPGTGSFLAFGAHRILGLNLLHSTALAKPFNLASNLASLVVFTANGKVIWGVAVPMAIFHMVGSWSGSHLAIRQGAGLVRKALLGVFVLLFISLALRSLKAC